MISRMKSSCGASERSKARSSSGRSPRVATIKETLSMIQDLSRTQAIDQRTGCESKAHGNQECAWIADGFANDGPECPRSSAAHRNLSCVKVSSRLGRDLMVSCYPIDRRRESVTRTHRFSIGVDVVDDQGIPDPNELDFGVGRCANEPIPILMSREARPEWQAQHQIA